jgi:hypothetical protein
LLGTPQTREESPEQDVDVLGMALRQRQQRDGLLDGRDATAQRQRDGRVKGTGDGCLQGNGTWQAPAAFESISVGERVAERSSTLAYQAWIDDVAISNSARIGCPPAQ